MPRKPEPLEHPHNPEWTALSDGDTGLNNGQRAERAARVVAAYAGNDREDECHPRDLICDLLHLLHSQDSEPGPLEQLEMAKGCFLEESRND